MARIWNVLHSATSLRARLTTSQLVERAWRSLGGDTWLNPTQLTNTRRFFQLLDEVESPGNRIDLTVLEDRLDRLFAEPEPVPAETPFLELLTIHKAKGLEWDVVFVPALERSPGRNRPRLLTWSEINSLGSPEDTAAHIMLAPIGAKGQSIDPLSRWLNSIHYAREAAERKRLFYVACTRARQELHLFATPQLSKSGLNPVWDSLLKAAWPAAELHFDQNAPAATITTAAPVTFAIAAAAEPPILQRMPPAFDPAARFVEARARKLPYGEPDNSPASEAPFLRPEGSFAARSFGNVVHACLEMLSERILNGSPASELLAELPSWTTRISAMFRADGLPRVVVDQRTREARATLETILRDPNGVWLLAPHARAASELAIIAWPKSRDASSHPASIRIDRVFHAGPEPHIAGEDFLWIVDYKTATHGTRDLEDFLSNQQATYGPQLEAYARILAPARSMSLEQVRLALYFPAIPRLVWWRATPLQL
jgi:ATP-dependent exoDNAse (exonuclease V) beta subunit